MLLHSENQISPIFWSGLSLQLNIICLIYSNWGIVLVVILNSVIIQRIMDGLSVLLLTEFQISPVFRKSLCTQLNFIFLIDSYRCIILIILLFSMIIQRIMNGLSMLFLTEF